MNLLLLLGCLAVLPELGASSFDVAGCRYALYVSAVKMDTKCFTLEGADSSTADCGSLTDVGHFPPEVTAYETRLNGSSVLEFDPKRVWKTQVTTSNFMYADIPGRKELLVGRIVNFHVQPKEGNAFDDSCRKFRTVLKAFSGSLSTSERWVYTDPEVDTGNNFSWQITKQNYQLFDCNSRWIVEANITYFVRRVFTKTVKCERPNECIAMQGQTELMLDHNFTFSEPFHTTFRNKPRYKTYFQEAFKEKYGEGAEAVQWEINLD